MGIYWILVYLRVRFWIRCFCSFSVPLVGRLNIEKLINWVGSTLILADQFYVFSIFRTPDIVFNILHSPLVQYGLLMHLF